MIILSNFLQMISLEHDRCEMLCSRLDINYLCSFTFEFTSLSSFDGLSLIVCLNAYGYDTVLGKFLKKRNFTVYIL